MRKGTDRGIWSEDFGDGSAFEEEEVSLFVRLVEVVILGTSIDIKE
jgi:hypothetical protein